MKSLFLFTLMLFASTTATLKRKRLETISIAQREMPLPFGTVLFVSRKHGLLFQDINAEFRFSDPRDGLSMDAEELAALSFGDGLEPNEENYLKSATKWVGSLPPNWRVTVFSWGDDQHLAHAVFTHPTRESLIDPRLPLNSHTRNRNIDQKINAFYQLPALYQNKIKRFLTIPSRNVLVQTALEFLDERNQSTLNHPIMIRYNEGESGIDDGALRRDFFEQVSLHLFETSGSDALFK
jgi:hypothetical protein